MKKRGQGAPEPSREVRSRAPRTIFKYPSGLTRRAAPLVALLLAFATHALAADWHDVARPTAGPPHIIGQHAAGCIAGAAALPSEGPGFQTIRLSRSRFWGHPDLITAIHTLGARARVAGLPDLYIGDLGQPRGGPMPWGHASHQIGLDADIWLDLAPKPLLSAAQSEAIEPPSLVRPDQRAIDPSRWTEGHARLLRLAAGLPGVERIFVHFAIKRRLCETAGADRAWLRTIRPWWGHAAHFHIRMRCPAGEVDCHDQAPPPAGDGCDTSLDWWFAQLDKPPGPPTPRRVPVLPAACDAVLAAPAAR